MSWFRNLFQSKDPGLALQSLQEKFKAFLSLLETNHQVLKIIADMEEKTEGEYLFDINYIRTCLDEIRSGVSRIIEDMITLGGERYAVLRERYLEIDSNTESLFSGNHPIPEDEFTLPLDRIGRERAGSVGSKSAQVGELKKIGLPTPDGFAITAWAYKSFLDANDLQDRISGKLDSLDVKSYEQLVSVSDEIQTIIKNSEIPEDHVELFGHDHESADEIEL
ncbi:PEP/pyruvate-binding domain-containing protein, partial [Thermodesulfobacteriota bacterium]